MNQYSVCGINSLWHNKSLSQLNNAASKAMYKYITNADGKTGKGILLYGPNGTGKSHAMNCALKVYVDAKASVRAISFKELLDAYAGKGEDIHKLASEISFLGIDDVDKTYTASANAKEFANAALDFILRYRIQRKLPTFMTTNLDKSEIAEYFNDSIESLFYEAFHFVLVTGEDNRKKNAKKYV